MSSDMSESEDTPEPEGSQAEDIINTFYRRMSLLSSLAVAQLGHAKEAQESQTENVARQIKRAHDQLSDSNNTELQRTSALVEASECFAEYQALKETSHESLLAEVIFTSIFSAFDAFLNELLRDLILNSEQLLKQLGSKEVKFSQVLSQPSEAIVSSVVDKEIEALIRDSYRSTFDKLAKYFKISTLKGFPNWSTFVEHSLRRNLITHCDGRVNQQYLDVCDGENHHFDSRPQIGDQLKVDREYLTSVFDVVTEVGLKLGQVLWRATSDDNIDVADSHIAQLIFVLLKKENWKLARWMGEFTQDLDKRTYPRPRRERSLKIMVINHAQAAMWDGDESGALRLLDQYDWSGSAPEFRLAEACLRRDWDCAAQMMQQVGDSSKFLPRHGYLGWPIFREFRKTNQFLEQFDTIFGVELPEEMSDHISGQEKPNLLTEGEDDNKGDQTVPVDPTE